MLQVHRRHQARLGPAAPRRSADRVGAPTSRAAQLRAGPVREQTSESFGRGGHDGNGGTGTAGDRTAPRVAGRTAAPTGLRPRARRGGGRSPVAAERSTRHPRRGPVPGPDRVRARPRRAAAGAFVVVGVVRSSPRPTSRTRLHPASSSPCSWSRSRSLAGVRAAGPLRPRASPRWCWPCPCSGFSPSSAAATSARVNSARCTC